MEAADAEQAPPPPKGALAKEGSRRRSRKLTSADALASSVRAMAKIASKKASNDAWHETEEAWEFESEAAKKVAKYLVARTNGETRRKPDRLVGRDHVVAMSHDDALLCPPTLFSTMQLVRHNAQAARRNQTAATARPTHLPP